MTITLSLVILSLGVAWSDKFSIVKLFTASRGFIFLGFCVSLLQGLDWYVNHLRMDEDGDLADQFLDEVSSEKPEGHAVDHHKTQARFKPNNATKSVRVKKQILLDGKIIPQIVESHQGRL